MIAPTLLVGLGGKGSEVIAKVADLATAEQRKSLSFVAFDTDANELKKIREEYPAVKVVQTSTKLSVGEYLNIDTHARDSWFPVNAILNSKTLTEGAGQVRAISRLAFDTALRAGKLEPLHEAIQELYRLETDAPEQALRIIIVSSLAGGTGSGLILPVALYIRNYLATRFRQSANIARGFFLLPEIFDMVIPGQAERNNLRSNAYATLRELDAFLMKGDSTLDSKYQESIRMEFPRVGSEGFEEYLIRPFDFCFLYDAKNADGKSLNSFNDYIDHAASCIYAQSIGPMHKRSNSSEDNTIRRLCAEQGRNRYAGAGTSMLIYPKHDVERYLALNWAQENVSELWLMFDKIHRRLVEQNRKRRSRGENIQDIKLAQSYIDTVEQRAKDQDPFSRLIVNACTSYATDGITREAYKWEKYVAALKNKIEAEQSSGQVNLDGQKARVSEKIASLRGGKESWEDFIDTYKEMEKYRRMVDRYNEETSRTIAFNIFESADDEFAADDLPHQLETYLKDSENKMIHPNAIRYFLYKALDLIVAEYGMIVSRNSTLKKNFESFVKNFDDQSTEDVIETVDDLASRNVAFMSKFGLEGMTGEQEDFQNWYRQYFNQTNEYRVTSIQEIVLAKGIEHIQGLSEAFETFYGSFSDMVTGIERQMVEIVQRYEHTKGKATRYVCASRECLEAMADQMPYTGSFIEIDHGLAERIYKSVFRYSKLTKMPGQSYFKDLFNQGIIGYYGDSLMKAYGTRIDVNILDALEEEARLEAKLSDSESIELYVRRAIQEGWNLSCPFIEKPLGEEREPLYASTYHPKIDPGDGSRRSQLLDVEVKDRGGTADSNISRNMILFYQSFYGLRANDLSKFAPPEVSLTSTRDGGEYFKAYFELIENIHPEAHKSRAITPHIDRWWHIVTKMPDLDEGNQELQERNIFAAFFWSLADQLIELDDDESKNPVYWLIGANELGFVDGSDTLYVSNGTPCDHLYEVLDAISIYPELVTRILSYIDFRTRDDLDAGINIEKGLLHQALDEFRVKEYPLGDDNQVRSIFDLPMLMRRSVKSDVYNENYLSRILEASLEEIYKYLSHFYPAKELPNVYVGIIKEQFERFLVGIELERDDQRNPYRDRLFNKICRTVVLAVEKQGLREEVEKLEARIKNLTS